MNRYPKASRETSDERERTVLPKAGMAVDEKLALREVLTNPDADEPRQKFADLIKEVDPERSQFIRAQLRVAQLDSDIDNNERFRQTRTSSRLLRTHYEKWRPKWAAKVDAYVEEVEFYRGFVELVQISGEGFLRFGSQLFEAAPVRHLDFVSTAGRWADLAGHSGLKSIRSITLNNNQLDDDDIEALAASPYLKDLRWLTLINNKKVTQRGIEAIAANYQKNLPSLTYVSFEGTGCNPVERYAADGDDITETWLPEIGKNLEETCGGRLPWLHTRATKRAEIPPLRFARKPANNLEPTPNVSTDSRGFAHPAPAEVR